MNRLILASACILTALACIAVHPTVQVAHDALIVNTDLSSFIIDSRGAALAIAPVACGIDTDLWCDVSSSIDSNK